MTPQAEKDLNRLVIQAFAGKDNARINAVKDLCLTHFASQLQAFQQKMANSQSVSYEQEVLLINDSVEIMVSGWLPGNTCYPHDQDQAECFVFVLNGKLVNTMMRFENAELEITGKTMAQTNDHVYLPHGTVHYMQNTGTDQLICLHVYTPGISERQVFDEASKTIYTLHANASAWLPASPEHVLDTRTFEENAVDWLIY